MSKTDISRSVKNGTAKQKIKLIAEHFALLNTNSKGLFNEREAQELIDSLKTPQEIRLFNKTIQYDRATRHALYLLKQYQLTYREAVAYVTAYSLLWESYLRSEDTLNEILFEIKDKKLKEKLIENNLLKTSYIFAGIEKDKEDGFIRFATDKPRNRKSKENPSGAVTLEGVLELWTKQTITAISQTKAIAQAMTDYMEETDFKPKPYKEMIEGILEDIHKDRAISPKYSKRKMLEMFPDEKTDEVFNKFFVFPDPEEIEIDQDFYEKVRRDYLER
jgi:hypothetical protein